MHRGSDDDLTNESNSSGEKLSFTGVSCVSDSRRKKGALMTALLLF